MCSAAASGGGGRSALATCCGPARTTAAAAVVAPLLLLRRLRYGSAGRCCNRSLRRARALVARPKRRSRKHLQQLRRSIQSREHAAELLTVAVQRSLRVCQKTPLLF